MFCLTRHVLASLPLRQLYSDWLPVTNRRSEQLIASGSAFKLSARGVRLRHPLTRRNMSL